MMSVGFLISLNIMINPSASFMPYSVTDVYDVTIAQHADRHPNEEL
jgi:hypothetical protein